MNETIHEHITRTQRGLASARDFHADYLVRRRQRGKRTATDILMEQHQATYADALDLLEAFKAIIAEQQHAEDDAHG